MLTKSQEDALSQIKEAGYVKYSFDPFKIDGYGKVTNMQKAMQYRVSGFTPSMIDNLIEAGVVRAEPYGNTHGRIYPVPTEDE